MKNKKQNRGITLLITLLLMTVLLGISASLLNITLKQYKLAGIAKDSEMAFQAANAGIECAAYNDLSDKFDIPGGNSMSCFGTVSAGVVNNLVSSGGEQKFRFAWGTPTVCTDISVYKFYNPVANEDMSGVTGGVQTCPMGSECTVIKSRGYNTACTDLGNTRTIEREIMQTY